MTLLVKGQALNRLPIMRKKPPPPWRKDPFKVVTNTIIEKKSSYGEKGSPQRDFSNGRASAYSCPPSPYGAPMVELFLLTFISDLPNAGITYIVTDVIRLWEFVLLLLCIINVLRDIAIYAT